VPAKTQKPVIWELADATLAFSAVPSDRVVFSSYFNPVSLAPLPENADPQSIDILRKLLQSEIGWLFLDRTRIRPTGFALGEHVQSLSLAPGEELVVEQKTFSKRETTFEDQTEQERQIDLELASTLSTELTEGLDREASRSEQTAFQLGGSASSTGAAIVKADASYSKNISEASSQAQKRSVKDTTTASSKVAAKYRAIHKTVLKISTESRFEAGSKRVIRNPNPYTAVDLHYFKIMQRLELVQERYGCRLCWAVAVKDPATDLMQRISNGKQLMIERAVAAVSLPKKPDPPAQPNRPPRVERSIVKDADKWGVWGDMRAEYDLAIPIPAQYIWNGDVDGVRRQTTVTGRPPENMSWTIVGTPVPDQSGNLIVKIRVGANAWVGGPKITMQAAATFVAQPLESDPAYQKAYQDYKAALLRWEADAAAALDAPRRAAETAADEWAHQMLQSLDPARELMDQIARRTFRGAMSDEPWEISFWSQVFDWERAGVALYPSWWSDQPSRDYLRGPNNFLNASWAMLYLPARPGFERLALRWIIAKVRDQALDGETEKVITGLVDDLKAFRAANFGSAEEASLSAADGAVSEKFLTLGRWEEALPTDGTHMEIVQSMTSAVDAEGQERLRVAAQLLANRLTTEQQDVELKKKTLALSTPANAKVNYQVAINTEDGETTTPA
jgi:hypothetical protein